MKILFLDIDGVLNHATTKERIGGSSIFAAMHGLDLKLLKRLLDWTALHKQVGIVLSSTWRLHPDTLELVKAVIPIIDVTPNLESRQREIEVWLSHHPEVEAFAILDDMQFFKKPLSRYFVQTSYEHGLLPQHLMRVEEILGLSNV